MTPVFPDNQDPEIRNYLSLQADETHFEQEVEFIISNRSEEKVTIQMEPLNALNSPQMGIQYTLNTEENNTRLLDDRFALAQYIDMDETITLAGSETKTFKAVIDIPELDGTILGAVGFKTVNKDGEKSDDQLEIHNELNRIIGIQINKEMDNKAEFVVDDPYIDPMSSYYVIRLPIALSSSLLMKDVLLDYEVLDEKGHLLFESKGESAFNIAPNTQTEFSLPWEHDTLEENKDYTIRGKLKYENQTLAFDKVFDYNEARAEKKASINTIGKPNIIKESSFNSWFYVIAILVVLGGGTIVYKRYHRKKVKNEPGSSYQND